MRKTKSMRARLWLAFVAFAALIFCLLWLLQTVFLQSFYDRMLIRSTRAAAKEIAAASQEEIFPEVIDRLSRDNALLVFVTDPNGTILYSSDAYKSYYRAAQENQGDGNNPYHKNKTMNWQIGSYRNLPDGYDAFLTALAQSPSGETELRTDGQYVYGAYIDTSNGSRAVLYVSVTLGTVSATVSILRVQLLWVTALSLGLAFALAWLLAKRFAVPVTQLSRKAKALASENDNVSFQKGFCRELDELSDALDSADAELKQARSYQRELLANVSHDLRTPLTMIKGYAEMVRDISWEDERQRSADTGVIIREADRLTELVNEILEYSSLQAGKQGRDLVPVDLGAVVKHVLSQFGPLLEKSGGHFEAQLEDACMVNGDAALLERLAYNLVDNGTRHMGEDKTVFVSVYRRDGVCLSVEDHGTGISAAELDCIWERYYTSRQRGIAVSGLGLAIVRQIAEIHGARYGAESKQGDGTCFRIMFPAL